MRIMTFLSTIAILFSGIVATEMHAESSEAEVADYIKKFPYQDTFDYMMRYTAGDPSQLNVWVLGAKPELVKAGDDKIVRMNNDTFYKLAFISLENGPVRLQSEKSDNDRFSSFQIMDDRNVNFRNVIRPKGTYTLFHGDKPANIEGEAIEAPSHLVVLIVRVEVKDKNSADDMRDAKAVFNGIAISGPKLDALAKVDLLSGFDEKVAKEATRQMEETFASTPISKLVAGADDVPDKVSYLQLATGTKFVWGGPVTSHSAYESFLADKNGKALTGKNGTYTITTEEPPVNAFWSITVYDTDRGGFLHPNKDGRHHINNTGVVRNDDGTITFTFKTNCEKDDLNCLEVPEGKFDLATRYYLPKAEIISGQWKFSKPELSKE